MPRTLGDIPEPGSANRWPPEGWHNCVCTSAEEWRSPKKRTPAIMLKWQTEDANFSFDDPLYTKGRDAKATTHLISRLALVAQRVCGMPKTEALPDDDADAIAHLAGFILSHARGKIARVLIEAQEVARQDPETGALGAVKYHRVAFAGYDAPKKTGADLSPVDAQGEEMDSDLPF